MVSVFRLLGLGRAAGGNHVCEVSTGEGKSVSLGLSAAFWCVIGVEDVFVVCYSDHLSARDEKEFAALFSLLQVHPRCGSADDLAWHFIRKQFPDIIECK